MRALWVILLLVSATTINQYDRAGNRIGELTLEGHRWVQRGVAGNPHGYWEQNDSGCYVHRDNAGDLLGRTCPAH